jgi:hypothetical protein
MATPEATAEQVRAIREQMDRLLMDAKALRREMLTANLPLESVHSYVRDMQSRSHDAAGWPGADAVEAELRDELAKLPTSLSAGKELGGHAGVAAEMTRLIPIIERAREAVMEREQAARHKTSTP